MHRPLAIAALMLALSAVVSAQQPRSMRFSIDLGPEKARVKDLATVGIRGNLPPLSWDKTLLLADADKDGIFEGEISFPFIEQQTVLEYKYIYDNNNWEKTANRCLLMGQAPESAIQDTWEQPIPLSPGAFPLIPAGMLQRDYALAVEAYRALHPGLDRYQSMENLEQHFRSFEALFSQDMDYRQAYLRFSQLAAGIRCGHTYANFYNQSDFIRQLVFEQPDKLPLCFRFIGKRMIVTDNISDDPRLSPGTEILEINEVPLSRMLDSLLTVVKADGDNDGKRIRDLDVWGFGRFESFDIYFPLFFPPSEGSYRIKAQAPGAMSPFESVVPGIGREERKQRLATRAGKTEPKVDDLWQFEIRDGNIAYLRLGTFATWLMQKDWRAFLKQAFQEITAHKIAFLAIDIRGNEGGNDEVILELAKYLARKEIRLAESRSLTRYDKLPEGLAPYLSSWDDSFRDMSKQVAPAGNGFFRLKEKDIAVISRQAKAYQGEVFLLIDAANSSATFYLTKVVKENQLATLIGETTGGSLNGLNGGRTAFLRLPLSGIELDIPLIGTFFEGAPQGGVAPDIRVTPAIDDVLYGRDSVWEAVRAKLSGKARIGE